MPLVTAVIDPQHPLLTQRRALVEQLAAVDRQIADAASTSMREALRAATAPPALAHVEPPKQLAQAATPRRDTMPGRRTGAIATSVKHEREIKTALVGGAQAAKAIAKRIGVKREDVTRALKQLRTLGHVVKNGDRGPSVTWQLAMGAGGSSQGVGAGIRARAAAAAPEAEFDTVWPPKSNPRASLADTLQAGARA